MSKVSFYHLVITLFAMSLVGCATLPDAQQRTLNVENLAIGQGWSRSDIPAGIFTISAFSSHRLSLAKSLHVYIEGDGLAWINRETPSRNPTPLNPLALQLAMADPSSSIYLGRPCQYAVTAACDDNRWWMGARLSPEIIQSMGLALDAVKLKYGATDFTLIGYSGGGAVAAILAAERTDVSRLITVAGNLDIQIWTNYHHALPLQDSLNPADYIDGLVNLPQTHFVGGKDKIVPIEVATAFAARFPAEQKPRIITIEGYGHQCCWTEKWPTLIEQAMDRP